MESEVLLSVFRLILMAFLFAPVWVCAADAQSRTVPGNASAAVKTYEWTDPVRRREIPVKIYAPIDGKGPFPVIMFSHGLGGSRDGYEYLGRYWAENGYVCVHLQHKGSDTAVWKNQTQPMEAMARAAADPQNVIDRAADVRFAIDQIEKLDRQDPAWKGRLDLRRIGMAGHSFGASTTLVAIGQRGAGPWARNITLADPRIKAAIALSSPVPRRQDRLDQVYGSIRVPCFHMTGTRDNSPIGTTTAEERRIPYDHVQGADQYLAIFSGADHMVFAGSARRWPPNSTDAVFQELIRKSSLAFWDAYLKGDTKAKHWLAEGGFQKALGKNGTFERKDP